MQYQLVSPESIYIQVTLQSEQVVCIYLEICVSAKIMKEIYTIDLRESKRGCIGRVGRRNKRTK